jgi:hypothetical protein
MPLRWRPRLQIWPRVQGSKAIRLCADYFGAVTLAQISDIPRDGLIAEGIVQGEKVAR